MGRRLRRALRFALVGVVVLILPGALLLVAAAAGAYGAISKADPAWRPALSVLVWARLWALVYRVPYSMALAILHNEGASTPRQSGSYPLGDVGDARGPSVGPGQVLRVNVESLSATRQAAFFLVRVSDAEELAEVGNERRALWYAVKMMRAALDEKEGDVRAAIARYNGHGPKADAYAERAEDFLDALELGA